MCWPVSATTAPLADSIASPLRIASSVSRAADRSWWTARRFRSPRARRWVSRVAVGVKGVSPVFFVVGPVGRGVFSFRHINLSTVSRQGPARLFHEADAFDPAGRTIPVPAIQWMRPNPATRCARSTVTRQTAKSPKPA